MQIFLSYASEQAAVAEHLELALTSEGHDVFRDRSDLPSGEAYHAHIREAIDGSDLFVFLVSPEAVASGRYTLTELDLAREKWPNPSGRVLPVIVSPTARQSMPPYLLGVTLLAPSGNVPASVAAAVARLTRPPWRRLRGWAAVLVIAGLVAAGFAGRWMVSQRRLAREISGLLQSGKVLHESGTYAGAWEVYSKAATRSPSDDDVARVQERLAMDWLENIRVTRGDGTFTAIVDKVTPLLARCAGTGAARRAADCRAHLGWADFLRAREGAGGLDPVGHYQHALTLDPDNVYAHAMWGFELLKTRGSMAEGRARFDKALASGRERDYVHRLHFAGLLWSKNAETENEVVRVASDMRIKGDAIPVGSGRATGVDVRQLWSIYYARLFNGYDRDSFLAAVLPADHVATFRWLFPESAIAPDQRNLRLFMLAALEEHAGSRADALAHYQAVRDALAREGTLAAGGRLPEGTLAALARLSKFPR